MLKKHCVEAGESMGITQKRQAFDRIKADLKKLGIPEAVKKWASLEPLLDADLSKFRAIAVGRHNTGKSTLLNVLCDRFNDEWFKTADVIETTMVKEAEYRGVVYVDTPGLGTTRLDDDLKSLGISLSASVVLFVHSCLSGELDKEELEILKRLAVERDNPAWQILILCTKKRNVRSKKDVEDIVAKVREQTKLFSSGKDIEVIGVDSLDYGEGTREKEPSLIDASNISRVKQWVKERRCMKNPTENRLDAVKIEVAQYVAERREALQAEYSSQITQGMHITNILRARWRDMLSNAVNPLQRRYNDCAKQIGELRDKQLGGF
jgi:tRNA U34 5-carboxymethylaminomethyl modifying GTPase MnmE/TrmE